MIVLYHRNEVDFGRSFSILLDAFAIILPTPTGSISKVRSKVE